MYVFVWFLVKCLLFRDFVCIYAWILDWLWIGIYVYLSIATHNVTLSLSIYIYIYKTRFWTDLRTLITLIGGEHHGVDLPRGRDGYFLQAASGRASFGTWIAQWTLDMMLFRSLALQLKLNRFVLIAHRLSLSRSLPRRHAASQLLMPRWTAMPRLSSVFPSGVPVANNESL